MLQNLNAFMNDGDRGPGHGVTQGAFYGLIFLSVESLLALLLSLWAVGICWAVLAVANHARVVYQENVVEGWGGKAKTWDYWYDLAFRPMQSDAISSLIFWPRHLWFVCLTFGLLLGYKRKDDKPFFLYVGGCLCRLMSKLLKSNQR